MRLFRRDNRLSNIQKSCVQDICMSSSFSVALAKYILAAHMLPDVAIVKHNESKHAIDLYQPFSNILGIENQLYTPFCGGRVSIINRRVVAHLATSTETVIVPERCVSFDTQTVSYLHRYYQGKCKSIPNTIGNALKVMEIETVGVDNIPYVTENLLFSNNKQDIVLETLLSFEKLFYRGKKNDRFCEKQAYNQLRLYDKQNHYKGNIARDLWKKVYVVLLEIARIQLSHHSDSTEKKMMQLCNFMDKSLGLVMYPELILAKRYFDLGQSYSFFGRIQKGRNDVIESIQNMTWDLFHLRMMEFACAFPIVPYVDCFIPYMFTYDKRLLEVKECYELEALAINTKGHEYLPFYAHMNEIDLFVAEISTTKKYEQRRERNVTIDFPSFVANCENALRQAAKIH